MIRVSLSKMKSSLKPTTIFYLVVVVVLLPLLVSSSKCISSGDEQQLDDQNEKPAEALKFKIVAIVVILVASAIGVSLPLLVSNISYLAPDTCIFFLIKAFAAGVILATGFIHVLPDAFESLNSPCLSETPWHKFPFAGLVAMLSAIGTLMMESFATGYHKRNELAKARPVNGDEEELGDLSGSHGGGHVHGSSLIEERSNGSDLIRHRIISQVLELGIVVHSVIIGLTLGASQNPTTVSQVSSNSSKLPSIFRRNGTWWMHLSGRVQEKGYDNNNGPVFFTHNSNWDRSWDRYIENLRGEQPNGSDRSRVVECSICRDSDIHGTC